MFVAAYFVVPPYKSSIQSIILYFYSALLPEDSKHFICWQIADDETIILSSLSRSSYQGNFRQEPINLPVDFFSFRVCLQLCKRCFFYINPFIFNGPSKYLYRPKKKSDFIFVPVSNEATYVFLIACVAIRVRWGFLLLMFECWVLFENEWQ